MAVYRLTEAAAEDLEALFLFGAQRFGVHQAEDYAQGLMERFAQIADQPAQWPAVDWIRAGYRRSVYGSHSIYYRSLEEGVLIVRILGRQSPGDALP